MTPREKHLPDKTGLINMNSESDSMQKTYNRFKADNIPVLRRGGDTNSHKLVTTDFFF